MENNPVAISIISNYMAAKNASKQQRHQQSDSARAQPVVPPSALQSYSTSVTAASKPPADQELSAVKHGSEKWLNLGGAQLPSAQESLDDGSKVRELQQLLWLWESSQSECWKGCLWNALSITQHLQPGVIQYCHLCGLWVQLVQGTLLCNTDKCCIACRMENSVQRSKQRQLCQCLKVAKAKSNHEVRPVVQAATAAAAGKDSRG